MLCFTADGMLKTVWSGGMRRAGCDFNMAVPVWSELQHSGELRWHLNGLFKLRPSEQTCSSPLSVSILIKSNPAGQVQLWLPQCGVPLQATDLSYPPPPEGRKGFENEKEHLASAVRMLLGTLQGDA